MSGYEGPSFASYMLVLGFLFLLFIGFYLIKKKLMSNENWTLFVEGHASKGETANDGRVDSMTLSMLRAKEVTKFLVEKGTDLDIKTNGGWTPVHFTAINGHVEILKFLVVNGADLNMQGCNGWAPVHFAANETGSAAIYRWEIPP